eukprot:TRINITY_DN724_c0_g1_i8.p1 TRINITY_DN724_c0_g1~~TRINITY_DN724_c0_g1_i8.p1  ORF type:complete len:419 (-),score=37.71 TRINITY_DN724_c0_g1_i8:259-1515(-)
MPHPLEDLVWIVPLALVAVPCAVAVSPIVGLAYGTSKLGSKYQRNKNDMLRNRLEKEWDSQMIEISKRLESNPIDTQALFARGMISFARGQLLMAISDLEACLELDLREPHVYYFVGMMYEQLFSNECRIISTRNQNIHDYEKHGSFLDDYDASSARDIFSDLQSARLNFSLATKCLKGQTTKSKKLSSCVPDNLSALFKPHELYTAKAINLYNIWVKQPSKRFCLRKAAKTMAKAMDLVKAKSSNKKRARTISSMFGVILYYEALYFELPDSVLYSWEIIKLVLIGSKDPESPFHIFRDADFAWHYFFRLLSELDLESASSTVYPGFYPTSDLIPKLLKAYSCFPSKCDKLSVGQVIKLRLNFMLSVHDPTFCLRNNPKFKSKKGCIPNNYIDYYGLLPRIVGNLEFDLQGSFPYST